MKKTITVVAAALLIALTSCKDYVSQVMYIDGENRGFYQWADDDKQVYPSKGDTVIMSVTYSAYYGNPMYFDIEGMYKDTLPANKANKKYFRTIVIKP